MKYFHKNVVIPLLREYGLFIHTCVPKNAIMSKDAILYFLLYNVICFSLIPSFVTFSK